MAKAVWTTPTMTELVTTEVDFELPIRRGRDQMYACIAYDSARPKEAQLLVTNVAHRILIKLDAEGCRQLSRSLELAAGTLEQKAEPA